MSTDHEIEDLDLGAALAAAIDSVEAGNAAPEPGPVEHEDTDPGIDTVLDASGAPVNESQQEPPADTTPAPDDQPDDGADAPEAGTDGAQIDAQTEELERAPSSWTPAVAEKWKELPAEVRAEIQRRESDYHKGIGEYKQQAAIAQEVQRTLQPYMANMQAAGVHPLQAVDKLMQADHVLRNGAPEQKAQFLAQIARDYGVDLSQVQPLPPLDPQVQALVRENQQLQQFQQAVEQQQQQAVMNEIETFRANPANVHFEAVKDDMAILLQSGRAVSLQDAYDKAVWMRPDIRQTLVHQQSANAQKQQAEAARRRRAQSAAGGVKGSAPSKTTTPQHTDLRSALEAAFEGDS